MTRMLLIRKDEKAWLDKSGFTRERNANVFFRLVGHDICASFHRLEPPETKRWMGHIHGLSMAYITYGNNPRRMFLKMLHSFKEYVGESSEAINRLLNLNARIKTRGQS